MNIEKGYLRWAKYFAVFAGLAASLIGSVHCSEWQFAGLTEDIHRVYFYQKISAKTGSLQKFVIGKRLRYCALCACMGQVFYYHI